MKKCTLAMLMVCLFAQPALGAIGRISEETRTCIACHASEHPGIVADWQAGRIPGAYHLELKEVFNKDSLSNLVKSNAPVVFYCNGPKCLRSSKSAIKAVSWGFKKVFYFRGGLPAWRKAGYPVE